MDAVRRDIVDWSPHEERDFLERGIWTRESLNEQLHRWAQLYGDRVALVEGELRLSFRALAHRVERVASGLRQWGLQPGDRALIQLPNSIAFVVAVFALTRIRVIPVLAMPTQREHDIDALCRVAEPRAYLVAERFLGFDFEALAHRIAERHPSVRPIVLDGAADPMSALVEFEDEPFPLELPSYRDVALLLLSGGTTGTPKLIPRLHAEYSYNARKTAERCGLSERSVYLAALPVGHNFPLACPGVLGTLGVGGRVILARTPSCEETFPLIRRERVTVTALVPALLELWLGARAWDETDLSSLEVIQVGGSRLEPSLARKVTPAFGCTLQQVFGMAEGLICCTRLDDDLETIVETQGRPVCELDELRIVDEDGRPVGSDESGELLVRGPYTTRGYYRGDAVNAERFTADGFYRTGDRVRRTPEGNLVVEGRIKEQINRAGEKVSASEVELVLAQHPSVRSGVIVGVPDARLGERICAFVVAESETPSLTELRRFLLERGLPPYKVPDQLEIVPSWPLTPVGKVDKARLRALATRGEQAPPKKQHYHEISITLAADPMTVAIALVRAGESDVYALYERGDEWMVGLGAYATIRVDEAGVSLRAPEGQLRWSTPGPESVASALAAVPVEDFRAYGISTFELAQVLYGKGAEPSSGDPLIELFVPRHEIRVREGRALVRALQEDDLGRLVALVRRCEGASPSVERRPQATEASEHARRVREYGRGEYLERVRRAVTEIQERRYQKVILSRRIPVEGAVDVVATFERGRRQNTPARSFLWCHGGLCMAGFSPEVVVTVDAQGMVCTQPLAGTRALGATLEEEEALRRELVNDTKEIAEHAVSVRLACEELSSVCDPKSVHVSEFMRVCRRGSVQHLGSKVEGQLGGQYNAWHAFFAVFPAVTASGIPKRQAVAAITRLEEHPRGPYSGCVMVVGADGSIDAALVLRSLYTRDGQAWLQAGAGVIDQSRPERELEETIEKLESVSCHLVFEDSTDRWRHRGADSREVETEGLGA